MQPLISYNIDVLEKVDVILEQLTADEFTEKQVLLFGSSIGQHIRHILEFYECLLGNLDKGYFSYDHRKRDLLLETQLVEARGSVKRSVNMLSMLDLDKDLRMESELPGEACHSMQSTTLKRELAYLADHGVHHLAMVRIALEQTLPHITFPEQLGVAASTRNHRAH
jgi:uncharacterized damage-inducible protein DinB